MSKTGNINGRYMKVNRCLNISACQSSNMYSTGHVRQFKKHHKHVAS